MQGVILVAGVVLLCQAGCSPAEEDQVTTSLKYLARHQSADGSWGERLGGCRCPRGAWKAPPGLRVGPELRRQVRALIEQFDHDDISSREEARAAIRRIGAPAGPQLEAIAGSGLDETALRCSDILLWMGGGQESADLELTGLSVLAFLSAGYTHLSRDEYGEYRFGTAVRRGLKWILSKLENAGPVDEENSVPRIIASLALCRAWELTCSKVWEEPATKAYESLDSHIPVEVRGAIWKGLLLRSSDLGGLPVSKRTQTLGNLSEFLDEKEGRSALGAGLLLGSWARRERSSSKVDLLWAFDLGTLDPESGFIAAMAGRTLCLPRNEPWASKSEKFRNGLRDAAVKDCERCERGSWEGEGLGARIRETSLRVLTLAVLYRYNSTLNEP